MSKRKMQYLATAEYRFFLYDPENDGMSYFHSAEDRDAAAAVAIGLYCEDGWSEEVERVSVGEVTAIAQKTNIEKKPQREDFDSEDDFDDAMEEWPDADYDETCNYELLPLTQTGDVSDATEKAS